MLQSQQVEQHHPFFAFSDSSWNDDEDSSGSTGCFSITYMGGILDHSSNLPDPVALSSAEAVYNEGCIAFMAASHYRMLLCELEGIEESNLKASGIYFDSKSAIAMGSSYKDTKHTCHIMRCDHYVHEGITSNQFDMCWINTEFQIADIDTKQNQWPRCAFSVNLIHAKMRDQHKLWLHVTLFERSCHNPCDDPINTKNILEEKKTRKICFKLYYTFMCLSATLT
jgi:hypothetical protein